MSPDEIAGSFDNRPGYRLINYGEVGLPVYKVLVTALTLAGKSLSPIDEFLLRSISCGMTEDKEIAGLLGLPETVVVAGLAGLIRTEYVSVRTDSDSVDHVRLNSKGLGAISDEIQKRPQEYTFSFIFDGLLRRPKWYGSVDMWTPKQLKEAGLPAIRAIPARGPELEELKVGEIADYVRLTLGPRDPERDVLRIEAIQRRQRMYVAALALVYEPEGGGEVQIAFAIDGRLSEEHETAFAVGEGPKKAQIFANSGSDIHPPVKDEVLGVEINKRSISELIKKKERRKRAVIKLKRDSEKKSLLKESPLGESKDSRKQVSDTTSRQVQELGVQDNKRPIETFVRAVPVYEHPKLLREAISTAQTRVLIISPWIRSRVVNNDFLKGIEALLNRSVDVYIGYGLGEKDEGLGDYDRRAIRALEDLSSSSKHFTFRRLGDTHAKVLIKDSEYFVTTSFNWLSFQGNRNRTFREEWGTFVGVDGIVDEYFRKMVMRFE